MRAKFPGRKQRPSSANAPAALVLAAGARYKPH
jgi:hypothetical protein